MTSELVLKVLGWVLPILLGPIVYVAANIVLNLTRKIDDLPAIAKQFVVTLIGTAAVGALSALGIAVPPECVALPNEITDACIGVLTGSMVIKGGAAAVTAFVIHAARKSPKYGR